MLSFSLTIYVKGTLLLLISQELFQQSVSYPGRFSSGDIRLIGGSSQYEGTVLIYHRRRWGSICDRRWDIRDANVVCRQLGHGRALQSIKSSAFGIGRRRKWLSYMMCRGTERRLSECRHPGWGIRYDYRYCSSRDRSAGVVCLPPERSTTTTTTTTIRPPATPRPRQVTRRPTTTTPKPSTTTPKPTTTTPKPTTTTPKPTTTTPKPTTTTPKPSTTTPRPTTTTPKPTTTTPKPTTTTPKPTTTTPKPTTTTPKPTTTTPKPTTTTITTQKPTTTQKTTTKPTRTTLKPTTFSITPKPRISPTTMSNAIAVEIPQIDINKTINNVLDSPSYNVIQLQTRNRSGLQYDDQSVVRRTQYRTRRPSSIRTTTTPRPTTAKPTTAAPPRRQSADVELPVGKWYRDRLLNMWVLLRRSGRILIAIPGERPKKVTRKEYIRRRRVKLGLPEEEEEEVPDRMKADDPQASGSIQLAASVNTVTVRPTTNNSLTLGSADSQRSRNVDTVISSSNSQSQNNNGSTNHRHRHHRWQTGNRGSDDDKPSTNTKLQIRAKGSPHRNRGRLEVLPPGKSVWGVICGDNWSMKETIVACKHLRMGYAQQAAQSSYYGGQNLRKYYSTVTCTGRESRLDECRWEEHRGPVQCKRASSVAGIVCANSLPDLVPSINMLETTAFLQDRPLYYLQCAMEEKCLGASAYAIQGSRGWQSSTRRLLRFSSVVSNKGTADFKPAADRSQWEWHACHMHYHSMDIFAHYDIVDDNGNRVAEGLKASFCLEDSECNPGVFPRYSCQNYGEQGISVGCSDNYMHDIDCQWIDITDLKPGKYTFKLEVNPNLAVAELSFENNVISCDLTYTGYYARIHNCERKSLL